MGQTIQIWDTDVVDDVLLVSTDRSFTGQDGESYGPGDPIGSDAIFPARLAGRLFESDPSIDHVYVMSNVLSMRRPGGWDDSSVGAARDVVASFFLFYEASLQGEAPAETPTTPPAEAETPEGETPTTPPTEAETPTTPPPEAEVVAETPEAEVVAREGQS